MWACGSVRLSLKRKVQGQGHTDGLMVEGARNPCRKYGEIVLQASGSCKKQPCEGLD